MRKILFATTALIATAGMAAAEVRLSGYGRFGLDYNEANKRVAGRSETNLTTRLRIQFDMSAETDGGVVFNARTRAQSEQRDGVAGTAIFNGARFGVSFAGLTVNVGNIIGAIENTPGTYLETRTAGIGIDGAGFTSHVGNIASAAGGGSSFAWDAYSSAGAGTNNGIEALYSAGGFTGHISYSQGNGGTVPGSAQGRKRSALMLSYQFGDWRASLGYQDSNVVAVADSAVGVFDGTAGEDKIIFSILGDIGQFGVRFAYAQNKDAAGPGMNVDKYGLYGNMDIGAASNLLLFVTSEDGKNAVNANTTDGTAYGIHYSYDLGGGTSFEAGAVRNTLKDTTFQAGVYFSF